tara:strand:- start:22963 stop:23730 length:768 start_codon:yes stop_codon:yes gene_type:complete
MPKKRLIFTLLYADGSFKLSRNFRLQRVGDALWINKNYKFSAIASSIDELIILNVARERGDTKQFCADLQKVSQGCFVPLALGGQVRDMNDVALMMASGADKIVLNTALFTEPDFVREVIRKYGSQCVVASLDFKASGDDYQFYADCGRRKIEISVEAVSEMLADLGVGEIYLNSMDADGTGQGYRLEILDHMQAVAHLPIIIAGGAGNFNHLLSGLERADVDAVATANLFNFVGNGLPSARSKLLEAGMDLARW